MGKIFQLQDKSFELHKQVALDTCREEILAISRKEAANNLLEAQQRHQTLIKDMQCF